MLGFVTLLHTARVVLLGFIYNFAYEVHIGPILYFSAIYFITVQRKVLEVNIQGSVTQTSRQEQRHLPSLR